MKTRTEIINTLISNFELDSYLEIGLQNRSNNFDKITLKDHKKISVDPDHVANADFITTSDQFFKHNSNREEPLLFDVILIDGLHHADQVKRDFENSLQYLTPHGFIVLHDCNPDEEIYTRIPRETKKWFGDCYKFACTLHQYAGIDFVTLDMDCGCCIVWRSEKRVWSKNTKLSIDDITWEYFQGNKDLINLISPAEPADQFLVELINHTKKFPQV